MWANVQCTQNLSKGRAMLNSSDCLFSARYRSGIEGAAWFECMSKLPDEDLIRLASLSAQAMQLAGEGIDTEPDPYLSLAAACNHELILRRARVGMAS
jgi:hypothetical protein